MAQHFMLAWKRCDFSGDLDQYCLNPIAFILFSPGGGKDMLNVKYHCYKYVVLFLFQCEVHVNVVSVSF